MPDFKKNKKNEMPIIFVLEFASVVSMYGSYATARPRYGTNMFTECPASCA